MIFCWIPATGMLRSKHIFSCPTVVKSIFDLPHSSSRIGQRCLFSHWRLTCKCGAVQSVTCGWSQVIGVVKLIIISFGVNCTRMDGCIPDVRRDICWFHIRCLVSTWCKIINEIVIKQLGIWRWRSWTLNSQIKTDVPLVYCSDIYFMCHIHWAQRNIPTAPHIPFRQILETWPNVSIWKGGRSEGDHT